MSTKPTGLQALSADECWRRLATHLPKIGRVAFVTAGRVSVLPVNYAVDQATVVIRTEPGSRLEVSAADGRVAFEVDELDVTWREGWSVLVKGTAAVVTAAVELERLRRFPLQPWAPGDRPRYLRIDPVEVTGRQIL